MLEIFSRSGSICGEKKLVQRFRHALIQNKHGIKVKSDFDTDGGKIQVPVSPIQPSTFIIEVVNEGTEVVTFLRCEMLRRFHVFTLKDEKNVTNSQPLQLNPGDTHKIEVICSMVHPGFFPVTLVFQFQNESFTFHIIRFFSARTTSRLIEELKPTAPYKPYQLGTRRPTEEIVEEGVKPDCSFSNQLEREVALHLYKYSTSFLRAVKSGLKDAHHLSPDVSQEIQRINSLLASNLQFENYAERFSLLLHLEEIQMEVDITRYNMENVTMKKENRLLVLKVPGVAENRPSVLRRDHLLVSKSDDQGQPITRYKGYVHQVELEQVKLGFSQKLLDDFITNMKFNVSFTFNRFPLQMQHRATYLAKASGLINVLFPTYSDGVCIHPLDRRLNFHDRSLERNPEQARAVSCIVAGISRPAPYLIFGPPGTGKTVTIVEAIKQVLHCIPTARILACAPSNSATDLLCQRIKKSIEKRHIYRLNAASRSWNTVPSDIKECSNWNESSRSYEFPSKETLMQYRVIASTLITAGRLASAKFPPGHFSHVFIDEAGHAVEPESIIAIAGLLDPMDSETNRDGGQLVLAGDPKQLGPVLRSPIAIKRGLELSLLERLMNTNTLYQKNSANGSYNQDFVTKLLRNYRSHPEILKIPNELFYEEELQNHADPIISNSYCQWEYLPKKKFPLIFHGVLGQDQREEKSPSFFNVDEIDLVLFYLKNLLTNQGKKGLAKISPKEIGVIAPYRKQVEKIRKAINVVDRELKAMDDIKELKVGSVEEFQGQERKVIIISTVRSSSDYLQIDENFNLGFLKNPKRFNVALTRAKALLIVIGNPIILTKDPNWNKFLDHCKVNQGYTGYRDEDDDIENDLIDHLDQLNLGTESTGDPDDISIIQQQLEPEWRSEV
ncbi:putative helicase MOV-10 isoform X2 [Pristis pectinata]|uniref:putative helicase MOV-10 isoform X2 n=1 Tax=Pristis pectinata TaxID=685728 RepID=UPI00223E6A69|nr:putative helicase MOV-10 isoform X2 [Pristis pectinata]XP_051890988.1 putative helicase MOV-10 isoform X2 [Pristis pectinata]